MTFYDWLAQSLEVFLFFAHGIHVFYKGGTTGWQGGSRGEGTDAV